MKWIALLSLVVLLSFSESGNLQRRSHEDGHPQRTIADVYTSLGEKKFKVVTTIMFAQYLQKNSQEDLAHLVSIFTAFTQGCKTDPQGQDCQKPLTTIAMDTICRNSDLIDKNWGVNECCSMADPEINTCFLRHKSTDPNFLPPYQKAAPEQYCKNWKDNRVSVRRNFFYEVARRYPFLYPGVILAGATHYEDIGNECCQESAKHTECLEEKKGIFVKGLQATHAFQKHSCRILKKFGTREFQTENLVKVAQKYPRATMDMWAKLSHDMTHLYENCCHGNTLACVMDMFEITKFICTNQDKLSTKVKACCDLEIGLQGQCLTKAENDEKPEGLSEKVTEFIEDAAVCEHYAQGKDKFLAKFLTEYGRRHQDFSRQMILRSGKGYEELLKECCQHENPVECLKKGEEKLKAGIIESKTLLKENCGALQKLGPYYYQNELIQHYFKKMPQIRPESLIELTSHMVKVGEKCCAMPEEKQMACSDEGLSIVIGEMCERQEKIPVSDRVSKCCSDSYSEWRPCFTHMTPDDSYVPPAITPAMFHFHADLCTASEKEAQHKKQLFLIKLLKVKPQLTTEQFETIAEQFLAMVGTYCKDAAPEECFAKELADAKMKSKFLHVK